MASEQETAIRSIEDLTDEYQRLNERKIQTQTQLETATKELKSLQKQAEKEFGTSDIAELEAKLQEMEAENEKRRSEYQTLLEGIAADLAKVEEENAAESRAEQSDDA